MSNFTSKGKKSIQGGTNIMIKDRQTKGTTTEKKKKKRKRKEKRCHFRWTGVKRKYK